MVQWAPRIGDPSFIGWFTTSSYLVCAISTFIAALSHHKSDRTSFVFWCMVTALMLLLAINKQLDLQSLFTEMARHIAKRHGWMERRRLVQFWFIVCFGTISIASFILLAFILRDLFRRFMLAFIGLFFLLNFIIIRAAGFHHLAEILQFKPVWLNLAWLLELIGIYSVVTAAITEILHL